MTCRPGCAPNPCITAACSCFPCNVIQTLVRTTWGVGLGGGRCLRIGCVWAELELSVVCRHGGTAKSRMLCNPAFSSSQSRTHRDRQVLFEITGGGTVSEEEEEEKQDPQWTRYRRQQAAARKGASGGGGDRHRRGAWTAAAQRCVPFLVVQAHQTFLESRHYSRTQPRVFRGDWVVGSSGASQPGGVILSVSTFSV